MLTSVTMKNFRGFADHQIPLLPTTIMVGKNNAGKSTIVEALKLISLVANRYKSLTYREPYNEIKMSPRKLGVVPSLKGIGFEFKHLCHAYKGNQAELEANFSGGEKIRMYLLPDKTIFATIQDKYKRYIRNKTGASKVNIPNIRILHQISPLAREEQMLNKQYVKQNIFSHLSSSHFRNQLKFDDENYAKFCELAESTWPKLQIKGLDANEGEKGNLLGLMVRDGPFVAEVGWMGHGLQMWLQAMWFSARTESNALERFHKTRSHLGDSFLI